MIGESNHLGRDGIHYDLFIKVGRLIVTLSPATQGPISPAISNGVPVSHTAGTPSSPFNDGGVPPRAPPSFIFFILSTYNLLERSIFWSCSTDSFCKTIVQ